MVHEVITDKVGRRYLLRDIQEGDAQAFGTFMRAIYTEKLYTRHNTYFVTDGEVVARIRGFHEKPSGVWAVLEHSDAIAGMLRIVHENKPGVEHTCWFQMFLAPSDRRSGLGTRLVQFVLDWARENGVVKISLSVISANTPAVELYRKFGFVVEGARKREKIVDGIYYDELIMALFLTSEGEWTGDSDVLTPYDSGNFPAVPPPPPAG